MIKSRDQMSREEATRSPIFLLQRRIRGDHYETESVWYSREESEQYLTDHAYNYRNSKPNLPGGRVYCVPCYGELSDALEELASLRAAVSERDELKRRLSDLFATINRDGGQAERDDPDVYQHSLNHVAELHQHLDALYAALASATGHPYAPGADFDAHEAVAQLRKRIAEQAAQLEQARDVMLNVAPDEPMNQDEQGGCVWCGGKPPRKQYGYATSNPKHHSNDCPWIAARAWLAANAPAPKSGGEDAGK